MYIIYQEAEGDAQLLKRPDGVKEKNVFEFIGFSNRIHPFHRKQLNWAVEMLKSANVHLHISEVPTVQQMSSDPYSGEITLEDIQNKIPAVPVKKDMRNLVLFQDTEMGRGWAVLLEIKEDDSMEIITQDHRDTVRDQTLLDAEWLINQGVSIQYKKVKDIDKVK